MSVCIDCDVELFDDPHWDDDREVEVCDVHCPHPDCAHLSGGSVASDIAPTRRSRSAAAGDNSTEVHLMEGEG